MRGPSSSLLRAWRGVVTESFPMKLLGFGAGTAWELLRVERPVGRLRRDLGVALGIGAEREVVAIDLVEQLGLARLAAHRTGSIV